MDGPGISETCFIAVSLYRQLQMNLLEGCPQDNSVEVTGTPEDWDEDILRLMMAVHGKIESIDMSPIASHPSIVRYSSPEEAAKAIDAPTTSYRVDQPSDPTPEDIPVGCKVCECPLGRAHRWDGRRASEAHTCALRLLCSLRARRRGGRGCALGRAAAISLTRPSTDVLTRGWAEIYEKGARVPEGQGLRREEHLESVRGKSLRDSSRRAAG